VNLNLFNASITSLSGDAGRNLGRLVAAMPKGFEKSLDIS
jgi:hypothetical protein